MRSPLPARLLCLSPSVHCPGLRPAQCRAKRLRQWDAYCLPRGKIPHFSSSHWEDIFPFLLFIRAMKERRPARAPIPPSLYLLGWNGCQRPSSFLSLYSSLSPNRIKIFMAGTAKGKKCSCSLRLRAVPPAQYRVGDATSRWRGAEGGRVNPS